MSLSDCIIRFSTNSDTYLHSLIPERYQGSKVSEFLKFKLNDKSYIANGKESGRHRVFIDAKTLEGLSDMWYFIIPTLPGAPELDINWSSISSTVQPAIENIIRNVGHITYYKLGRNGGSLEGYLKPPISTSRIIEYVDKIRTKEDELNKSRWLPAEQVDAAIEFLDHLLEWRVGLRRLDTEAKFKRQEVDVNLEQLTQDLKWLKEWKQEKEKEQMENKILARRRSPRHKDYRPY